MREPDEAAAMSRGWLRSLVPVEFGPVAEWRSVPAVEASAVDAAVSLFAQYSGLIDACERSGHSVASIAAKVESCKAASRKRAQRFGDRLEALKQVALEAVVLRRVCGLR